MEDIKFQVEEKKAYTIVKFELPQPITPNIFTKLNP